MNLSNINLSIAHQRADDIRSYSDNNAIQKGKGLETIWTNEIKTRKIARKERRARLGRESEAVQAYAHERIESETEKAIHR